MKKLFILVLLLSVTRVFSQQPLPPAYQIKTDTALAATLPDSCWQMLDDRSNKLTIGQVSSYPVSGKFHFDKTKKVDYAIHTNWFRFRLRNGMTHEAKVWFWGLLEQSDYYYKPDSSGKWVHKANGKLAPWSKKDGLKEWDLVPITLQPRQEITIYLRVYNTYRFFWTKPDKFSFFFAFNDKGMQYIYQKDKENYKDAVYDSFLFGFLLFACIFNLFFFYTVREKSVLVLFYSIYLFIIGIGRFEEEFHRLYLTEHQTLYAYADTLYWWTAIFSLTYFVRYLLKTYQYYPSWDKVLLTLAWITPLLYLFKFFAGPTLDLGAYNLSEELILVERVILGYGILITFLLFISDRKPSTRVLLYTVLPWVALWIICDSFTYVFIVLHNHFNLKWPAWVIWIDDKWALIENFTLCLMVISFSFNLFLRFYNLKQENARQALEKERLAKEKEIERNELIEQQKIELEKTVEERTAELKHSLTELKSTQSQLIQSEKMASLGELTAGIAHEIQNPLNFVNNFSEVNTELIDELKLEIAEGNYTEVNAIADDIKQNEQKINLHGKRADAIVKGMLQHSKSARGSKELTNINTIAEEYMRLAYHGLSEKDKSFKAEMVTYLDPGLPKISVIPQDIGRVLLNLFNNAFYAVNQKQKTAGEDYKPEVTVTTSTENGQVIIKVKDNGVGIPDAIKEKIMQPFFTTKPTGEGTGLGLSLTYDMVVKGHGGSIAVDSKEGEFTEFIVSLSLN